jgi:hypothetical protein
VYDTTVPCVWELIMHTMLYCSGAYTAIDYRWLLCVRALSTARKEACAEGRHESSSAGRS